MQIKRFEAKTMTLALKMVKDEFGLDAVILSARSLRRGKGLFAAARVSGVEVTAAKDTGWTAYGPSGHYAPPADLSEKRTAAAEGSGRPGLFKSLNHTLKSFAARQRVTPSLAQENIGAASVFSHLYQSLLSQEVQRDLAAELVAVMKQLPGGREFSGIDGLRPDFKRILMDMGLNAAGDGERSSGGLPRVTAFVGPPGVGKTTTAIKLAVLQTLPRGRKTALMTLDDHRIGAVDQLRIYAEILGLPLAVATSAAEASRVLASFQTFEQVIVDTPGISPGEEQRRSELNHILAQLKVKEVHLLLSACMREKDMLRVIDGWRAGGVTHLGFTRLDEAGTWGSLLNLPVQTQLPVSFLATGPRIPEDLVPGGLDLLVERLLPAAERRASESAAAIGISATNSAAGSDSTRLVANRNSDLYHLPGCKWTRKIKAGHLITFATLQEAESGNFSPCRDCSPHAAHAASVPAVAHDGRRASGYR